MSLVSTGLTEKGLRSEFFARFTAVGTFYERITTRYVSTSDRERHRWLGSVPPLREWGQGRLARGMNNEVFDIENLRYEATIEVDRIELDDDQTQQIRMRIGELAANAASHKDFLCETLLARGGESGFNSYDRVPFFSALHESGSSGLQSNDLTLTAVDPEAPTVSEARGGFTQAVAAMISFKDDQGQTLRMSPRPEGLVIACPPSQLFVWHDALGLPFAPNSETGLGRNTLQGAANMVIPMPELAATDFILMKTDGHVRALIFQDRSPIEFGALEANSETGFKREVFLYGVRARYALTFGEWRFAVRTRFQAAG